MNKSTKYNHLEIQRKWDKAWEDAKIYHPDLDNAKKPFYALYMFPYPSAEGLHVGHAFSGTGADIYARFKRMKGEDVFQPMGFDAFGIHSENFALKIGDHPQNLIDRATKHFREQFDSLGFSYDWDHCVNTSNPDYYKWTQWLFIQLFKAGLAEKKKAEVNWCPSCKTVLADEQVINKANSKEQIANREIEDEKARVCERCGTEVMRKELEQWFFKITKYADRLLEGLNRIDWTEKVKLAQKNWIGKSEGLLIRFVVLERAERPIGSQKDSIALLQNDNFIEVFTTKPETVDGATFLVLSPEHKLLENISSESVREYIKKSLNRSPEDIDKEKIGVFTGLYAKNPVTNKEIPVWVSNYVLAGYGTGAIMAVPYADERDKEFAKKFDLPIVETSFDSKPKGEKQTHYHLRDWLISRQRYWGAPIPMVFCSTDGWQPVDEKDLPVLLPYIENFKPLGTGIAPLAQDKKFVNTTCPVCNGPAKRETDVCDTFLDSSWYFLRYPSVGSQSSKVKSQNYNSKTKSKKLEIRNLELEIPWNQEITRRWLPVTSYIGGAEHSVLHLLYSRFVTKVLYDQKLLDFDEPFTKFRAHGLIIKEGAKMSKSRGNVVNPDEYIERYGADALRCYLMFLGPFDQGGDFKDSGIEGMERFLKRVRKLVELNLASVNQSSKKSASISANSKIEKSLNRTIKGVGNDVESLRYNTALAKIMEYVNDLYASKDNIDPKYLRSLTLLLAPFAPYLAEELWELLRSSQNKTESQTQNKAEKFGVVQRSVQQSSAMDSVHSQAWPSYDEKSLEENEVTIAVAVNGKLRDTITVQNSKVKMQNEVEKTARQSSKLKAHLEKKEVKKVIYIPGKIINFVV